MGRTLRIGNASGYWGDDPHALERQLSGETPLDYITMDFLAEITMSILQKQKNRDPKLGYARDFVRMFDECFELITKTKTKIITNAGGVNPEQCARELEKIAERRGRKLKIAIVKGDDILSTLAPLAKAGATFNNMEDGEEFERVRDRIASANVYFGAHPVVEALKHDPDIVITGRVTDTGITLAPMIHHFGWSFRDYDKLASGIVAGHLLECGSQSCGGNFTDWETVPSFDNIGFPLVEVHENGSFILTKQPHSGGMVTEFTAKEQLFYEMGSPKSYITPDVVADFSSIQIREVAKDRVEISGVKGRKATPFFKISMAYHDGFKCVGSILIAGSKTKAKAQKFSEIFWKRVGTDFEETQTELFGLNACHREIAKDTDPAEILLKLGARSKDEKKLQSFAKMIPALILGGPPGVAVTGGVAPVMEVVSYWPALIRKELVTPLVEIHFDGKVVEHFEVKPDTADVEGVSPDDKKTQIAENVTASFNHTAQKGELISKLAYGRSGDKGDTCNIGIVARNPAAYMLLKEKLTAQFVKNSFQSLCKSRVIRYELDNMQGLNFLLEESLGGGGTQSLQSDPQGKTYAQALLSLRLPE